MKNSNDAKLLSAFRWFGEATMHELAGYLGVTRSKMRAIIDNSHLRIEESTVKKGTRDITLLSLESIDVAKTRVHDPYAKSDLPDFVLRLTDPMIVKPYEKGDV